MLTIDNRMHMEPPIVTNSRILSYIFLFALACICCCSVVCAGASVPRPVIVAYVFPRDTPLHDGDIAAQKLTRINYAFANIKDGFKADVKDFLRSPRNAVLNGQLHDMVDWEKMMRAP